MERFCIFTAGGCGHAIPGPVLGHGAGAVPARRGVDLSQRGERLPRLAAGPRSLPALPPRFSLQPVLPESREVQARLRAASGQARVHAVGDSRRDCDHSQYQRRQRRDRQGDRPEAGRRDRDHRPQPSLEQRRLEDEGSPRGSGDQVGARHRPGPQQGGPDRRVRQDHHAANQGGRVHARDFR